MTKFYFDFLAWSAALLVALPSSADDEVIAKAGAAALAHETAVNQLWARAILQGDEDTFDDERLRLFLDAAMTAGAASELRSRLLISMGDHGAITLALDASLYEISDWVSAIASGADPDDEGDLADARRDVLREVTAHAFADADPLGRRILRNAATCRIDSDGMCYALAASVSGARTEALQRLVLLLASFRNEAAEGQRQAEEELAAALLECDPGNGVSHLLVARIALRHGDRDRCVESLERAARCARWQFYGGEFPGRTSQQFARGVSGSLLSRQAVVGPVGDGIRFFEGTAPIFWIRGNRCCEELALEIRKTPLNPKADREAAMQVARLRVHAYLCSVRLIAAEDASSFDWLIGNKLWEGMRPLVIAPAGDEQDDLQRLDDAISMHFQSYRRQQDAQRQAEDGGEAPRSAFERHAARAIDEGPSWNQLLRQSGLTAEFVESSVAAILAISANPDR